MRNLTILLIATLFFNLQGAVADYTFEDYFTNAVPTVDGILLGDESNDDQIFTNLPLGFLFRFNGEFYNTVNLSTNGFISFSDLDGAGIIVNPFTHLLKEIKNVISALSCDLAGKPGSKLIYKTIGSAPYRTFVAEWSNYGTYQNTTDDFSFRISLNEADYKIQITYLSVNGSNTTRECAVGLKRNNSDFNIRQTNSQTNNSWLFSTPGSSLSAVCLLNQSCEPPTNMCYEWTPYGHHEVGVVTLSVGPSAPIVGEDITIRCDIQNYGDYTVKPLPIRFKVNGNLVDSLDYNSLPAGVNFLFSNYFTPQAAGIYHVEVELVIADYDMSNNLASADVTVAEGAVCNISPVTSSASPYSFGYWPEGSESPIKQFLVSNTGVSDLHIDTITMPFNDDSYQMSIPPLPWTLPPGHANAICILFKPHYSGPIESQIELTGSFKGNKSQQKIHLVGYSYPPYATINETFESFNNNLPIGWNSHGNVGVMNNSNLAHSGSKAIAMSGSNQSVNSLLILPGMNSIASKTINLWAKDCDGNGNNITPHLKFQLGTMSDYRDTSTFVPRSNLRTASSIYSEYTLNTTSSDSGFLAIKLFHTGNNILIIDDLSVDNTSGIDNQILPEETKLHGNYPNPFNPATAITYDLASAGQVGLTIHNAKGELVCTLVNTHQNAGRHSLRFNAEALNSGVYFCRLATAGTTQTHKMLLCK